MTQPADVQKLVAAQILTKIAYPFSKESKKNIFTFEEKTYKQIEHFVKINEVYE